MARKAKNSHGSNYRKMAKIYADVAHPASLSTAQKLAAAAKVSVKEAREFLSSVDAYTLHRPRRLKFKRNRYILPRSKYLFEADLCDLSHLKKHNNLITFLLTIIDCFSKFAWCIPLKNKKGDTVLNALKTVIRKNNFPSILQVDEGKEFKNKETQKYLTDNGVKISFPKNSKKCHIVERFNRTLEEKLFKYMTHKGTQKYVDVLPKVMSAYNSSVHSAIGMAPIDVKKSTEGSVWHYLYGGVGRYPKLNSRAKQPKYSVGTHVRISRAPDIFRHGYEGYWGHEIYKIKKVFQKEQTLYELEDLKNNVIEGRFYEHEIQKVTMNKNTYFRIDKIHKKEGKGRSCRLLVSWVGYPDKEWIYERDLKKL